MFSIGSLRDKSAAQTRLLRIDQSNYQLEEATTAAAQEQGLGGRLAMDADRGMLFAFAADDQRCFWMKDMHFPLDMIWVNHANAITHIESGVAPSTYPQTFCAIGQFVIELHAGEATKNHLKTGQTLTF